MRKHLRVSKCLRVKIALVKLVMPFEKHEYAVFKIKGGHSRFYTDPWLKPHYLDWCLDDNTDWFIERWVLINYGDLGTDISWLLTHMTEVAVPSLREHVWKGFYYLKRVHYTVSIKTLSDQFLKDVKKMKLKTERWNTFLKIFEDFIKLMKSFRDFNMEALLDFLAANEQHDLWLIVATIKDYSDESTEDRFSL